MTSYRTVSVGGAMLALGIAFLASAWAESLPVRIKVLSGESRHVRGPALAPPNCNWLDISAYCYDSSPKTYVENTMVVQEPDGKSLQIGCTVYNQWSHCTTLPVNHTYEALTRKRGLEIRYLDQHGKSRKQLYEILSENGKGEGMRSHLRRGAG